MLLTLQKWSFLNLALGAACVLILYKAVGYIAYRKAQRSHGCKSPPHYWHWDPIFGTDTIIGTVIDVLRNRNLLTLAGRHESYGPTYQTTSLGVGTIWSKDPELIQCVWGTNDKDWGNEPFRLEPMEPFCGQGFITMDGDVWEHSRALVRPTFHNSKISDLSFIGAATEALIARITQDGSTIDLQPLLFTMFLDSASYFLFNHSMGAMVGNPPQGTPVDSKTFLAHFQDSLQGMGLRIISGGLRVLIPRASWDASCATVHRYVDYLVEQAQLRHKPASTESKNRHDFSQGHSLLDDLVEQSNDKAAIRNHLIQAMMAAQDTTSILIANAIFLLSHNPSIWCCVRYEAMSLEANKITFDTLQRSELLQNILLETLRLYPIFSNLSRAALQDTVLPRGGGADGKSPIFVPKGTTFNGVFYCLHREPSIYGNNTEAFDPDRWKDIKPGPFEFMGFGQGRRRCLGQQKALVEAAYVLVKMALTFERIERRESRPYEAAERVTTSNVHGCKIAVIPANS